MTQVVLIADFDDPDVLAIASRLGERGVACKWIKLGLEYDAYSVLISTECCEVEAAGVSLDIEEVASTDLILYRRWRSSPPGPVVQASITSDPWRFTEREWESAFSTLLERWSFASRPRWSRAPLQPPTKLTQLRRCEMAGVRVPSYEVSTRPRRFEGELVTKALSLNQSVGDGRFVTRSVHDSGLEGIFDSTQPCPVLLQRLVEVKVEIRAIYSFGSIDAVAQMRTASNGDVDIRLTNVERRRWAVSDNLREMLEIVSSVLDLELFSADVLIDEAGDSWLIDVNHDGLIAPVDDQDATLLGAAVAGIINFVCV